MQELIVVLADLYLAPSGASDSRASRDVRGSASASSGLDSIARYGRSAPLRHGWRAWLAHRLLPARFPSESAVPPPAVVASFCPPFAQTAGGSVVATRPSEVASAGGVWMATPVHLLTGLATLHLERRGLLGLGRVELDRLADEFNREFVGSGFALVPVAGGEWLLTAASAALAQTVDPARLVGQDVAEALPRGAGASRLRQLGAEVEMWLHDHPVNVDRRRSGELPVSGIWLWGGGVCEPSRLEDAPVQPRLAAGEERWAARGDDAFLAGVCSCGSVELRALPERLEAAFGYARAPVEVLLMQTSRLLAAQREMTLEDALDDIDRRYVAPAVRALNDGSLRELRLLANDHSLTLTRLDRWRFWRRAKTPLAALG